MSGRSWLELTPSALEQAEVEKEFQRSFERQFHTPLAPRERGREAGDGPPSESRLLSEFMGLPEADVL